MGSLSEPYELHARIFMWLAATAYLCQSFGNCSHQEVLMVLSVRHITGQGTLWSCQSYEPRWLDSTCSWDFRLFCCSCMAFGWPGSHPWNIRELLKTRHLWPFEFQLSSSVNKWRVLRATRMKVGRKVSCHMEDTSKFPSGYLGKHRNQCQYQARKWVWFLIGWLHQTFKDVS